MIKIAFAPASVIEGKQRLDVGIRNGATESAAAQPGQYLAGAGFFILGGGRPANEYARAARRLTATSRIIRAGDQDVGHLWRQVTRVWYFETFQSDAIEPHVHFRGYRWNRSRRCQWIDQPWSFQLSLRGFPKIGDADSTQPRFDRHANFVARPRIITDLPATYLYTQRVFDIQREIIRKRQAPARIKRQIIAFRLITLLTGATHATSFGGHKVFFCCFGRRIPNGQPANQTRNGKIAFEQRWRN